MDYSTINIEKLKRLPECKLPPTYRLQHESGNGCFGDPPGYPSYFTRSVYTQYGNSPRRGVEEVISCDGKLYTTRHSKDWNGCKDWDEVYAKYQKRLRSIWLPPPEDHPRVQAWEAAVYQHMSHCYVDVERPEYNRPGTLVFPVPDYKLKPILKQEYVKVGGEDRPHWSDEYLEAENHARRQFNADEINRAAAIAIPENHKAVIAIREFYPEHKPILAWIDGTEQPPRTGNWYETEAVRPKPEECKPRSWGKHPINGSWCQWCGWEAPKDKDGTKDV